MFPTELHREATTSLERPTQLNKHLLIFANIYNKYYNSSNKYLLSSYNASGSVLGAGDTTRYKTQSPHLRKFPSSGEWGRLCLLCHAHLLFPLTPSPLHPRTRLWSCLLPREPAPWFPLPSKSPDCSQFNQATLLPFPKDDGNRDLNSWSHHPLGISISNMLAP